MISLFNSQSFRGSPRGITVSSMDGDALSGSDSFRQFEPKYPASLFKQQLTAYIEKIYGLIRDNLKREISPLLGLCIQVLTIMWQNRPVRWLGKGLRLEFWYRWIMLA